MIKNGDRARSAAQFSPNAVPPPDQVNRSGAKCCRAMTQLSGVTGFRVALWWAIAAEQ